MIQFMVRGRQFGKTTALIQMMQRNPGTLMLVHDGSEVGRLEHEYPDLRGRFVNAGSSQALDKLRGRPDPVYIDNLDLLLHSMLGLTTEVVVVTATGHNL